MDTHMSDRTAMPLQNPQAATTTADKIEIDNTVQKDVVRLPFLQRHAQKIEQTRSTKLNAVLERYNEAVRLRKEKLAEENRPKEIKDNSRKRPSPQEPFVPSKRHSPEVEGSTVSFKIPNFFPNKCSSSIAKPQKHGLLGAAYARKHGMRPEPPKPKKDVPPFVLNAFKVNEEYLFADDGQKTTKDKEPEPRLSSHAPGSSTGLIISKYKKDGTLVVWRDFKSISIYGINRGVRGGVTFTAARRVYVQRTLKFSPRFPFRIYTCSDPRVVVHDPIEHLPPPPSTIGKLARLPFQVRAMIYKYVLEASTQLRIARPSQDSFNTPRNLTGLLRANKELSAEAMPIFYFINRFALTTKLSDLEFFLQTISETSIPHIKTIVFPMLLTRQSSAVIRNGYGYSVNSYNNRSNSGFAQYYSRDESHLGQLLDIARLVRQRLLGVEEIYIQVHRPNGGETITLDHFDGKRGLAKTFRALLDISTLFRLCVPHRLELSVEEVIMMACQNHPEWLKLVEGY